MSEQAGPAAVGVYLAYHALGWLGERLRRVALWLDMDREKV